MVYSQDLRQCIMLFILQGGGRTEAAKRYAISERTVYRWLSQPVDYQPQSLGLAPTVNLIERSSLPLCKHNQT